jgi:hypothetical protein
MSRNGNQFKSFFVLNEAIEPELKDSSPHVPQQVPKRLTSIKVETLIARMGIMNPTLLKALVTLVPASILFSGSSILFFRRKTLSSFLQLLGAGCLLAVVLTHVCEALDLLPLMYWGQRLSGVNYYFPSGNLIVVGRDF